MLPSEELLPFYLSNFLSLCHLPHETSPSLMLLYTFQLLSSSLCFLSLFSLYSTSHLSALFPLCSVTALPSHPTGFWYYSIPFFFLLLLFFIFLTLFFSLVTSLVFCPATTQARGKVRWASEVLKNNNNRTHPAKGTLSEFHYSTLGCACVEVCVCVFSACSVLCACLCVSACVQVCLLGIMVALEIEVNLWSCKLPP